MIQAAISQVSSQEFVQLYSSAPRDLSFLRSFRPSFELLSWDPSNRIYSNALEMGANLTITKVALAVSRYAYRFLEPGIMLLDSKRRWACELPKDAALLKQFLSEENLNQIKKRISDAEPLLTSEVKADASIKGLGSKVTVEGEVDVYLEINPEEFISFKRAIEYLHENLTNKIFWNQPDKESLSFLIEAHCELSGGISYLRTKDWMIIPLEEVNGKKSYNLQKLAKENGLSEADTEMLTRMGFSGRLYQRNEYTKEEERIVDLIAVLPTKTSEIIPAMEAFINKLKKQHEIMQNLKKVDYVKLAAFALQSIGKILPFENDNQRLARAFATALLMQGGHDPILFHNLDELMLECRKGKVNSKGFEAYLERCIQMTTGLQAELRLLS